jgi:hypothetical protein
MRISNDESDSFALLPIFSFDDDYVQLSPVATPSPDQTTLTNQNNTKNSTTDSFPSLKALTTISETSEFSSSRTSSVSSTQLTSPIKDIPTDTSPIDSNKSPKSSILNSRSSPEVHVLDVTDLTDPSLRISSKFSFKDPDDKLTIAINGK